MAENKIYPWAQSSDANVFSDDEYATDVATGGIYVGGVQTGLASSKQANKTWRQAVAPGAGLAQFLVDNLSVDVTDSDTPSTFSSRIANAVLKLAQISPFNQSWAAATGGYRKYAIVSDNSGNFWASTADQNMTVPGTSGAKWQNLFNGYATETWVNGRFQPVGNYVKTLPSDGMYAPVLTIQHKNTDGTLAVRYEENGSGFAYFQPAGDYATNAALSDRLKIPGTASPWIQSTAASFNGSDGTNGTVITLATAYQNRCLFAFGNDVGDGAHSFGTEIIDAGHVRIFGKEGGNFINSVMNLITIGY